MGAELMLPRNNPEAMLAVIEVLCQLWRAAHPPVEAAASVA